MGRKDSQYRSDKCLNCNTPLDISERYCHHCGQLNSTKKLTLRDFFDEFFSNFYAYDSKIRNSLIYLFTKPGILPKRFIAGERTTFANPFRLFLSVSILLFITANFISEEDYYDESNENNDKEQELIIDTDGLFYDSNTSKKDSIITEENLTSTDSVLTTRTVLGKTETYKAAKFNSDSIYTKKELKENSKGFNNFSFNCLYSFRNFYKKYPKKNTATALTELGFENSYLNRFFFDKAKNFKSSDIEEEIEDYLYQKLPFLLFLSVPFITLIFWLVFYKKSLNYTDHLIFTYSFYSFLFICAILFNLADLISTDFSVLISSICFGIIFPYYLYRSLRNFYGFSRWKTIFKFVLLHPLFLIMFTISVFVLFSLGFILI